MKIADKRVEDAASEDSALGGDLVSEPVAEAHDLPYNAAEQVPNDVATK